jgi:hypothetical protein
MQPRHDYSDQGEIMEFEYKERTTHPLELVYPAVRDRLVELPAHLPNVDFITELSRIEKEPGKHHIVNEWHGNSNSAPSAVRPFLSDAMTNWKDFAIWSDEESLVRWRFETSYFEKLYTCEGINYFEDNGDGTTQIRLTGELRVYPERVPGVPRLLAKRLSPKVEAFLINLVTPNLAHMPHAVQALLDSDS